MLGVTLGGLYVDAQGYVPALLQNLRGMSRSGAYWLFGGGWFQWRYGSFWMISLLDVPCTQEFSGVLRFWA